MSLWTAIELLKKDYQQELKDTEFRINKIISSVETTKKDIQDFPEVSKYFEEKFPKIDLSDISIYMASPRIMSKHGFANCGGFYIDMFKSVCVKTAIRTHLMGEGKFDKTLSKLTACTVAPEDVVVHELMHAVSHKVRSGAGARFRNSEEEFVYTNCTDFYRLKNMSDDDIVKHIFLPFCINDTMTNKKSMLPIWSDAGVVLPIEERHSKEEYKKIIIKLLNKHADNIAPVIVTKAKELGYRMIDLYNKYGQSQVHTNVSPNFDISLRMDTLDMDCEL